MSRPGEKDKKPYRFQLGDLLQPGDSQPVQGRSFLLPLFPKIVEFSHTGLFLCV